MTQAQAAEIASSLELNTCQGSFVHFIVGKLERVQATEVELRRLDPSYGLSSSLAVFGGTLLLFGGGLTILPALTSILGADSPDVKLPIYRDYAALCMNFLSIPMLVTLLSRERVLIPRALSILYRDGSLRSSRPFARVRWEKIFRTANISSQGCGALIGILFGYMVENIWTRMDQSTWQFASKKVLATGWMYLFCLVVFWFVCVVYFVRAFVIWRLLNAVTRTFTVIPQPFHPDRAGGLHVVADLGLRNQYVLSTLGAHIALIWIVTSTLTENGTHGYGYSYVLTACSWAGTVGCIVLGALSFVLPLLPFRRSMLCHRNAALTKIGHRMQVTLDVVVEGVGAADGEESIERLQRLTNLVRSEPVWPFDTITIRKFVTAFLIPSIAWIAPARTSIKEVLSTVQISKSTMVPKGLSSACSQTPAVASQVLP